ASLPSSYTNKCNVLYLFSQHEYLHQLALMHILLERDMHLFFLPFLALGPFVGYLKSLGNVYTAISLRVTTVIYDEYHILIHSFLIHRSHHYEADNLNLSLE